jgi:hypothetical protein
VREAGNPLLKEPFALGSRDRGSGAIVVVERLNGVSSLLDIQFGATVEPAYKNIIGTSKP